MYKLFSDKKEIINFFNKNSFKIKLNKKNNFLIKIFSYYKLLYVIIHWNSFKLNNYKLSNNISVINNIYGDKETSLILMKFFFLFKFQFLRNAFKRKIKKRYYSFIKRVVKNKLVKKHYKKYNFFAKKKKIFFNHLFYEKIHTTKIAKFDTFFYKISVKTANNLLLEINVILFEEFRFYKGVNVYNIISKKYRAITSNINDLNLNFKRLKFLRRKKWKKKKFKKNLILQFKKKNYILKKKKKMKLLFFYNYKNLLRNTNKIQFLKINNKFSNIFKKINIKNTKFVRHEFYSTENTLIYNNFYPLYNMYNTKYIDSLVLRNIKIPGYNNYYNYYLLNFLEIFLKKQIWIKINTQCFIPKKVLNFFSALFAKNKKIQNKLGKHLYLFEFYEILYLSLFFRDSQFLMQWVKKFMEKIHLRFHKRFLKLIYNSLKEKKFLKVTNLKGFMMDARGKLGTTGNSKKKHYMFIVGNISYTTKNHDLSVTQDIIRTSTGALGMTIVLSY